jgi:hypothetical protein
MKAITLATVGLAATAATANAAALSLDPAKACYIKGESATLSGSGFTAGGAVNVSVDGKSEGSLQADTAGNFAVTFNFVGKMNAVKSHPITATDATNPAITATLPFVGTTYQVATPKNTGRAGRKYKLRGYGFLFGRKAFMHVRGHGISTDTFLARPKAPCGTFTVKKRISPPGAPFGTYRVQFDSKKKYSKKTANALKYKLRVFPVGASSAFAGVTVNRGWTLVR